MTRIIVKYTLFIIMVIYSNLALAKETAPLFDHLGQFHHAINTKNPLAQRYFDQGLVLFYSFEYGESIRSFKAAIKTDPECAMCYWGLALALGSKTDMPLNGHELTDATSAIHSAMEKVDKQNLSEKLYIAALAERYTDLSPQKMDEFAGLCSSYSGVTGSNAKKYADAMKKVSLMLPDDADAKTLYAASLFDLAEWNFWNQNGSPNAYTLQTIQALESAFKQDKNNPGANHLYVHIIESSPNPEKALPNAEQLSKLVPDSEHLAHMPCHIFYTMGRYHDATIANQNAIKLYKNYVKACQKQGFLPETQYLYFHNYDYLVTAASMEGRKQLSIAAADELAKEIYPYVEMTPALQKNLTDQYHMRVRFGEWNAILKMPAPLKQFQYDLGIWHYARGVAEINLNQIDAAKNDLTQLQMLIKQGPVNESLGQFGITLLTIAANSLNGLLMHAMNDDKHALEQFKAAVKLQDTLLSADPPPWPFPTRQLLGSFLLKINHVNEAKVVFLDDLKKHPNNGWSLYGLAEVYRKLGHKKEAEHIDKQFKKAWQYSDIPVPTSLLK